MEVTLGKTKVANGPTERTALSAACPACAAPVTRIWGYRSSLPVFECGQCGIVFFDREAVRASTYDHYYNHTVDWDAERAAWELAIRRRKFETQLRQLGRYVKGRKLLDIGAGPGYYCRVATDQGWKAWGVEISQKAVEIGREFLKTQYVPLEEVPTSSLDVVTCHHVIEHVDWPTSLVGTLREKLVHGGVMAVHVPHRECFTFQIRNRLGMVPKRSERLCALYAPEHLTGFNPASLACLFERNGFTTLRLKTVSMWSSYYDPFFLKNYLRRKDYTGIVKHTARCLVDKAGAMIGQGDWIIGHFRKAA